jgi:GAF domain-containing protein
MAASSRHVSGERRLRILAELVVDGPNGLTSQRLGEVCQRVTGVTGASIMLMSGDVVRGSLCATDEVSAMVEELQYTLGEGPCVDAYRSDRPVLEPDLVDPVHMRWVAFGPPAIEEGVRAIFGFPMRVGVVRLGALNLYCDRPGTLSDDQYADALVMADVAASAILSMQAGAQPGKIAEELAVGADFQYVVHQAAGMVSEQMDETVTQALIRLRAHAFSNDRHLDDVAADVVAHRLRFDDGDAGPGPAPHPDPDPDLKPEPA